MLIEPEKLPQTSFDSIPTNGIPNFLADNDP